MTRRARSPAGFARLALLLLALLDYATPAHEIQAFIASGETKPAAPAVITTSDLAHLGAKMYVGITASTGSSGSELHHVLAWTIELH